MSQYLPDAEIVRLKVDALETLMAAVREARKDSRAALESKAIHTHGHINYKADRRPRAKDATAKHARNPELWKDKKQHLRSSANRQYARVKDEFRLALRDIVFGFQKGKYTEREFDVLGRAAFETAYIRTFRYGLKASGVSLLDHPTKRTHGPELQQYDERWVKSSLKDERKYWNKFMGDIVSGDIATKRFTAAERIDMYADTLDHVYDAGRVVGHPSHSIIYWVMNREKEHCSLCDFLQKNSPYTRETLPGVPRDGNTCLGLSRCGCELRIVTLDNDELWQKLKKRSRQRLTSELARLKKVRRSPAMDTTFRP